MKQVILQFGRNHILMKIYDHIDTSLFQSIYNFDHLIQIGPIYKVFAGHQTTPHESETHYIEAPLLQVVDLSTIAQI